MKIDDLIFSKFVGNALTKSQMMDVEKQLIADGEISAAVEASIIDYEIRQEEANIILGTDNNDSKVENNDKNVVRNADSYDSVESNNTSLTTKNGIIMNINFKKEEMERIQAIFDSFKRMEDNDKSIQENLIAFYQSQRPGVTTEEAKAVAEGIAKGVQTFNKEASEALKAEEIDYAEKLRELGENLTNEEKYEAYVNFLSAIMVLDVKNFDEEKAAQIEDFEMIKARFSVDTPISDEMLDELIEEIDKCLKENTFCIASAQAMATLLEKIPSGSEAIAETLLGSEEDIRQKYVTAMAMYIAYQNGEAESLEGQEITPEYVALLAAAGIEEARAIEKFRLGIISKEDLIFILKVIGGVLLWSSLLLAVILGGTVLSLEVFFTIFDIFGTSAFIGFFASIVAIGVSVLCTIKGFEIVGDIVEWSSNAFDDFVEFWQNTAWPYIKEKATQTIAWIRGKQEEKVIKPEEESEPSVVIVGQS